MGTKSLSFSPLRLDSSWNQLCTCFCIFEEMYMSACETKTGTIFKKAILSAMSTCVILGGFAFLSSPRSC